MHNRILPEYGQTPYLFPVQELHRSFLMSHSRWSGSLQAFPGGGLWWCGAPEILQGPFPDVRFCPTGGLGPDNAGLFLSLANVVCCGGSWMVTEELTADGRWSEIEALAREALSL